MKKIAIYDMDRTITRRGTYTPFLIFVAKQNPFRMLLLPAFFVALLGYPLKLLDRLALKQIGFRLIIGKSISAVALSDLSKAYAIHVCKKNMYDKARNQIVADKADGCLLLMATASPDFYASEIGAQLGFDHVLGTVQARTADGDYISSIASANCYAEEKLRRVQEWLPADRKDCHIRFYSDHHSDEPVFNWADQQIATNANPRLRALARQRDWAIVSYA